MAIPLFDVGGVSIAFLNATSSLNGIPLPDGQPFAVTMIDSKFLLAQAAEARAQGAELVIAVLHWGEEYSRQSSEGQREVAHRLLNGGIDVIIGSHPHVVQPIQRLTVERGGRPFTTYVAYSLGNFVSNQRDRYRDSGIVLFVDIEKNQEGVSVTGVRFLPVWVQKTPVNGAAQYRVLPCTPGWIRSNLPLSGGSRADEPRWQELTAMLDNRNAASPLISLRRTRHRPNAAPAAVPPPLIGRWTGVLCGAERCRGSGGTPSMVRITSTKALSESRLSVS